MRAEVHCDAARDLSYPIGYAVNRCKACKHIFDIGFLNTHTSLSVTRVTSNSDLPFDNESSSIILTDGDMKMTYRQIRNLLHMGYSLRLICPTAKSL